MDGCCATDTLWPATHMENLVRAHACANVRGRSGWGEEGEEVGGATLSSLQIIWRTSRPHWCGVRVPGCVMVLDRRGGAGGGVCL